MVPRWLLLAAAAASVAAACSHQDPTPVAGSPGRDALVVASFNFPESELVAELYAQVLEAGGVPVQRQLGLGPRELVLPALEQGLVDLVPEYAGSALAAVDGDREVRLQDSTAVLRALRSELATMGLRALAAASAQNQNGLVVTGATAAAQDLRVVSDLAGLAHDLTLGGPPECPGRPYCLRGLDQVYGLQFGGFVGFEGQDRARRALEDGVVDVAVMFTTDGRLAGDGLVLLDDDRALQPVENIVPVVRVEAVDRYGDRVARQLREVSARLTTTNLRFLNWRVSVARGDIAAEARGWLLRHGLIPR